MHANEILKHYRGKFDKNGFVDVTDDIVDEDLHSVLHPVTMLKLKCGTFYKKLSEMGTYKSQMDAEVLLSQVYHKLGFKTAIYVPAQTDSSQFILCNDISGKNIVPASDYHFDLAIKHRNLQGSADCLFDGDNHDYVPLFSPKILKKRTEMFLTDCAALNYDRVDCNYYYQLKNGKPVDIILIDYESSGENFSYAQAKALKASPKTIFSDFSKDVRSDKSPSFFRDSFQSDFNPMFLSRKELIASTKDCKELHGVFDANEFANRLGNVDIKGVAKDIKEEINYKVNDKYVDLLASRFDETAEMLRN